MIENFSLLAQSEGQEAPSAETINSVVEYCEEVVQTDAIWWAGAATATIVALLISLCGAALTRVK